jgi:AraC-like DNA-binding protein
MLLVFEDRESDSPFVERVWRAHSERAGTFVSVAASHLEMVVSRVRGRVFLTLRGPETKPTHADCPADGEWLGIRFALGTFLPKHPTNTLIDRQDEQLPDRRGRFELDGFDWDYPTFDNAETFVQRLVRRGIIARDDAVLGAVHGDRRALSRRTRQRHFLRAAGMTHARFCQIERARYVTRLLQHGVSILDAVHEARYFDQAHLTRSLGRFIGRTPARIVRGEEQLSFLYKTTLLEMPMMLATASHHDNIINDQLDRTRPQRAGNSVPDIR